MAVYVGREGSFAYTNSTTPMGFIDNWSLSLELEPLEITGYGEAHKQYTAGVRNWGVTFSGTLDMANAKQSALFSRVLTTSSTASLFALYMVVQSGTSGTGIPQAGATSQFWTGAAYISGVTVNAQVADKINVTFNAVSRGDLTYTDAT